MDVTSVGAQCWVHRDAWKDPLTRQPGTAQRPYRHNCPCKRARRLWLLQSEKSASLWGREGQNKVSIPGKHYRPFPLQMPSEIAKKSLSWKDLRVQINSQVTFTSGPHSRLSRTVMLLEEGAHSKISISYIECPFPLFGIMKQH